MCLVTSDFQRIMLVGLVVSKCPSVREPAAPRSFSIIKIVSLHPRALQIQSVRSEDKGLI